MFGLSMRERLIKLVETECMNCLHLYEEMIREIATLDPDTNEEELNETVEKAQRIYFDAVCNEMFNHLRNMNEKFYSKVMLALQAPEAIGLDEDLLGESIAAGRLYYICHYVITGKEPNTRDCIKLNHFQGDAMNAVIDKIEQEYN